MPKQLLSIAVCAAVALSGACAFRIEMSARDDAADGGSDGSGTDGDAGSVPAPEDPAPPPSLKTVKIPQPDNLSDFVRDETAALVLGKALFWDMQVGGDGIVACASCHFHAGADNRSKNQLSPGLFNGNPDLSPNPDSTFQIGGPNYQLKRSDFPFHRKEDPEDRNSKVLFDVNDVSSSQGVFESKFLDVIPGRAEDENEFVADGQGFSVDGTNTRRVEARNAPTVINAVFNFRNFWDGRAQNEFNGVNHLGSRDPNAKVLRATASGGLEEVRIALRNSSLASQAMQPVLSDVEMSGDGRTLVDVAEKFLRSGDGSGRRCGMASGAPKRVTTLRPLAKQLVASDDGVLGAVSRYPKPGLTANTYAELIKKAFHPVWWDSARLVRVDESGKRTVLSEERTDASGPGVYTLMEANFSLFFGIAIQTYEATLVSDETPFDRYREGDASALSPQQKFGLNLFLSQKRGRCINCHGGAEFTDASVTRWSENQIRRREGNVLDFGFNNIGVRPTLEDLGNGFDDVFGRPLSVTRLALRGKFNDPTVSPPLDLPNEIQAADGAFKVPTLRNATLTAPYFHTGGYLTLRQVIDFYSRGGDFTPIRNRDGEEIAGLNVLNNTEEEKRALVAFLEALTDERVRYARAPFDHPQIFVVNGHVGTSSYVKDDGNGKAKDELVEIPAVGRNGGSPTPNFLE